MKSLNSSHSTTLSMLASMRRNSSVSFSRVAGLPSWLPASTPPIVAMNSSMSSSPLPSSSACRNILFSSSILSWFSSSSNFRSLARGLSELAPLLARLVTELVREEPEACEGRFCDIAEADCRGRSSRVELRPLPRSWLLPRSAPAA
eukprot:COSAG04_NODE_1331_length_7197_cov_1.837701_5_plen_146_part_01